MNDLFVNGDAGVAGKFTIAQKGALGPIVLHPSGGKLVHLPRCYAGLDECAHLVKHRACEGTSRPHCFQISLALKDNHNPKAILPIESSMALRAVCARTVLR